MADLMGARRRISLNVPHIITSTGIGLRTFHTDMVALFKTLKVYFLPVQEGSGNPTPSNIRLITGWDRIDVVHSDTQSAQDGRTITVTSPTPIYSGYVDLVNGEIIAEYAMVDLETLSWHTAASNRVQSEPLSNCLIPAATTVAFDAIGEQTYTVPQSANLNNYKNAVCIVARDGSLYKYYNGDDYGFPKGKFVYRLATPMVYSVNIATLKTIKGVNNIWSNTNSEISIQYWTHN